MKLILGIILVLLIAVVVLILYVKALAKKLKARDEIIKRYTEIIETLELEKHHAAELDKIRQEKESEKDEKISALHSGEQSISDIMHNLQDNNKNRVRSSK